MSILQAADETVDGSTLIYAACNSLKQNISNTKAERISNQGQGHQYEFISKGSFDHYETDGGKKRKKQSGKVKKAKQDKKDEKKQKEAMKQNLELESDAEDEDSDYRTPAPRKKWADLTSSHRRSIEKYEDAREQAERLNLQSPLPRARRQTAERQYYKNLRDANRPHIVAKRKMHRLAQPNATEYVSSKFFNPRNMKHYRPRRIDYDATES